uniref:TFCD_C domain-containing protein n=1 Tax=Syphacia muris TaxID=451379 RepID=A0A0N5AUA1_9BILA
MCNLLCCGITTITERELLCKVYLHNAPHDFVGDPSPYAFDDWRLKSCFSRLALLITSPHYSYWSIRGFIISAGGLTESTRRNSAEAVFIVLAQHDSVQFMEAFLHNITTIIAESGNDRRVAVPLLCFLDQLFDAQLLTNFEIDIDLSPSLQVIGNFLLKIAKHDTDCRSARLAVDVLCHFIHFDKASVIWRKTVSAIIDTLHCRYPLLRSNAAEKLYQSLATEGVLEDEAEGYEELLDLLANVNWQAEEKDDILLKAAKDVARFLNVSEIE